MLENSLVLVVIITVTFVLLVLRGRGHLIQRVGFVAMAGLLLLVVVFAIPEGGEI